MRRDERGSGLVLALAMLSIIGLILTAVLGFASSGLVAATTIRGQGERIYAADAGIERAIRGIRYNPELGRDPDEGGTCPTFDLPGVNGKTVTVTCRGLAGSGAQNGGPNHPRNAIMTLGTSSGERGIEQKSNNTLRIKGAVKSNSDIFTATSANMHVTGVVRARLACSSGVVSVLVPPDRICNINATPPGVVDPLYPAEIATVPSAPSTIPVCAGGWLKTLSPGRYSDVAVLNALTACPGSTVWFQPGVYYFDFTGLWEMNANDLNVVAGEPLGWSTGAPAKPAIPFPNGCDVAAPQGVQMIFAGAAHVSISKATVELCPTPHVSAQRISIYQRGQGTGTFARPSGCVVGQPYTGSNNTGVCALLSAGPPGGRLVSHGTVYAPAAAVDLNVGNQSTQILGRGIVSRIFAAHISPPGGSDDYLIEVPDTGAADRTVEIIASVDGTERVRAVVVLEDGGGDLPGQTIRVTSWSVRR